jgi:hypothetical protein
MAVTRAGGGRVITLGALNDSVSEDLIIQGVSYHDNTGAGTAVLSEGEDGSGNSLFCLSAPNVGTTETVMLTKPVHAKGGVRLTTLSGGGILTLYLV